MSLAPLTISGEPSAIADALLTRLPLTQATGEAADIVVSEHAPVGASPHHMVLCGPVTDAVDAWDAAVAPQTLAGALWLVPDQADAADAVVAWLTLRLQTPTTPLSDLTDNNGRALRWSVVSAATVTFAQAAPAPVDPDEVRAWVDAQPAVLELGEAVQRVGGDSAESVVTSIRRFRRSLAALQALGAPAVAPDDVDTAVAEHLGQVQRTGFARWRGAKARAASQAGLEEAVKAQAKAALEAVLLTREAEMADQAQAALLARSAEDLQQTLRSTVLALTLPAEPDFTAVPRSWSATAPAPRRYVFVHEDHLALFEDFPVTVRAAEMAPGQALCALVASGFSLPALR